MINVTKEIEELAIKSRNKLIARYSQKIVDYASALAMISTTFQEISAVNKEVAVSNMIFSAGLFKELLKAKNVTVDELKKIIECSTEINNAAIECAENIVKSAEMSEVLINQLKEERKSK